jgi:branched-subunit amino acid transport protein
MNAMQMDSPTGKHRDSTPKWRQLPDVFERFLACVPVAAFAALIVTGLEISGSGADVRILAAIPAALVALRWKKLWLTLACGMGIYWGINWII